MNYLFKKIVEFQKRMHLYRIEFDMEYIKRNGAKYLDIITSETEKELRKIVKEVETMGNPKKGTARYEKMINLQNKALKIRESLKMKEQTESQINKGKQIKKELEFQLNMLKSWKQ